MYWTSSSGEIELEMTKEQAESASHQGKCDDDVESLSNVPSIQKQLEAINPKTLRKVLKEFGEWNSEELKDHTQNLQRILWLAAGDIIDQMIEEDPSDFIEALFLDN